VSLPIGILNQPPKYANNERQEQKQMRQMMVVNKSSDYWSQAVMADVQAWERGDFWIPVTINHKRAMMHRGSLA
jgi:hypothetical protein